MKLNEKLAYRIRTETVVLFVLILVVISFLSNCYLYSIIGSDRVDKIPPVTIAEQIKAPITEKEKGVTEEPVTAPTCDTSDDRVYCLLLFCLVMVGAVGMFSFLL